MIPRISVIIPAHNEADFLADCLKATRRAEDRCGECVEIIVVLNRCSDATEEIALSFGCLIVREEAKNLSQIRNAGAARAQGEIIVTCDADSRMHPQTFCEICRRLDSGKVVGGGTWVNPERWSLGIFASGLAILPYLAFTGVSFGLFWCWKQDFVAIGGFDQRFVTIEDIDFAQRLKKYGRQSGRCWGTLFCAPLVTSCRKFDQFGDWYLFLNPKFVRKIFRGDDRNAADYFWYDVRSNEKSQE